MIFAFPELVRTDRLLLRPWRVADAQLMKDAIDANLDHLQRWMPWAMNEPSPLDEIEARIEKFADDFASGIDGTYGVFSLNGEVIGGAGLHPRVEHGLEIGYWISTAHLGQGYATEAAAALTLVAFKELGVGEVQIRCDPHNIASAAIPKRLAYRHIDTLPSHDVTPTGQPRDTMVWQMTRQRFVAGGLAHHV